MKNVKDIHNVVCIYRKKTAHIDIFCFILNFLMFMLVEFIIRKFHFTQEVVNNAAYLSAYKILFTKGVPLSI